MIVSDSHRFIFIHNPKVAGTSFRRLLEPFASKNYHGRAIYDGDMIDGSHIPLHKWPSELVERYNDGYTVFGLVRSPTERYRSALSELFFQHPDFMMASGFRDPHQFLRFILTEEVIRHDPRFVHFSPQWSYFGLPSVGPGFNTIDLLPRLKLFPLENLTKEGRLGNMMAKIGLGEEFPENATFDRNDRPSFHKPDKDVPLPRDLISQLYGLDMELVVTVNSNIHGFEVSNDPSRKSSRVTATGVYLPFGEMSTNYLAGFARSEIFELGMDPRNIRERNAIRERILGPRNSASVLSLREALKMPTS